MNKSARILPIQYYVTKLQILLLVWHESCSKRPSALFPFGQRSLGRIWPSSSEGPPLHFFRKMGYNPTKEVRMVQVGSFSVTVIVKSKPEVTRMLQARSSLRGHFRSQNWLQTWWSLNDRPVALQWKMRARFATCTPKTWLQFLSRLKCRSLKLWSNLSRLPCF